MTYAPQFITPFFIFALHFSLVIITPRLTEALVLVEAAEAKTGKSNQDDTVGRVVLFAVFLAIFLLFVATVRHYGYAVCRSGPLNNNQTLRRNRGRISATYQGSIQESRDRSRMEQRTGERMRDESRASHDASAEAEPACNVPPYPSDRLPEYDGDQLDSDVIIMTVVHGHGDTAEPTHDSAIPGSRETAAVSVPHTGESSSVAQEDEPEQNSVDITQSMCDEISS